MNIFVAGHNGMVGRSIVRKLLKEKVNIIVAEKSELNLLSQKDVEDFFSINEIDQVYLAAAKVGGIHANNQYPADFIYENLMIQSNIIHSSYKTGIQKLLFLGSSCIYPKLAKQPIKESSLLTGPLEPTNEPYAIAKIAGIKLCESYNRQHGLDYRCIMPTNLYGPYDNFHYENSHVIPALIRKFYEAKISNSSEVTIWGSGSPRREFLHVDDMATASLFIMNLNQKKYNLHINNMLSHINIGSGVDHTIRELAEMIANITKYEGKIIFDKSKPDGTPRKLMDVSKINKLGWTSSISLEAGLQNTYEWYIDNLQILRK